MHVADSIGTTAVSPAGIHGISLGQYASVHAALAEGFALGDVLAAERIDARTWPQIDAGWAARIVDDQRDAGPLFQMYEAELARAEDRLARRVFPLDDDLGAWIAFLQAFSGNTAPAGLLSKLGLGPNDSARLSRRWAKKLSSTPELRSKMRDLASKPRPFPRITATPADLRPSPFAPRRAPEPPTGSPDEETLGDDSMPAGEVLPFRPGPSTSLPPAPAQVDFTLEQYASLCVELQAYRGQEIRTLLRYRVAAARKADLDTQWQEHFTRSPGLRVAFASACERYSAFLTTGKVASW